MSRVRASLGGVAAVGGLAAGVLGLAAPALAGGTVAYDRFQAPETLKLTVGDIPADGKIPPKFTGDGKNVAPPVRWSDGPSGTKSYVMIAQDPDAPGAEPAVHWVVYGIPALIRQLPGNMRNTLEPTNPLGAAQGWNYHGSVGYTGPRPPLGDPPHHYHFQVFALDRPLRMHPGAQIGQVLGAMKNHVIARGQLVATYEAPRPKEDKTKDGKPQDKPNDLPQG
jgi:Raf kinase inhibitor-like YbhB/YbcL family protein